MRTWTLLLMMALTRPAAAFDAKPVKPAGEAITRPAAGVDPKPVKPPSEAPTRPAARVDPKLAKPPGAAPTRPPVRVAARPVKPAGETLVRNFLKTYNAHDIQGMLRFCAPDVRWMNIQADKISTDTTGDFKLDEAMQKYFKGTPSAHSELRGLIVSGPYVSTVEEASWVRAGKKRQQCSIGVYEISDSKIKNVWYFPTHDCGK